MYMPSKQQSAETQIYQLKITLLDSRPPIWRRVQVAGDISLENLHWVIQHAMGWTNSHLHHFKVGKTYYGTAYPDDFDDVTRTKDERTVTLRKILSKPKAKFVYEYDFGDSWEHEVLLEKILPPEPGVRYPVCITGKRACPPEDCGGVWGYDSFLEAIQNPDHPEHDDMLEWVGESFDPEAFDLEAVNRALRRIR
jgi:hypothetical protein